jgi:hypothetical protein
VSTIPYYPVPGSPEQMTGFPVAVQIAVAPPARQRRVTVFFRLLMVIPHSFVLGFLGIAAFVLAFIGWWGALFTGQLPEFAADFLVGYYRWSTRVQAYQLLLTDVYPPFTLDDDPAYPVRIAVPPRERLNRLAVLFRFILVIPASLLGALVVYGGATIVAFVAWLITLFTGKLPSGLHLAYVAMVRYLLRVNCYFYMLTPTYPQGLFGDRPAVPTGVAEPPVVGYGIGDAAPGYSAPGGYETPGGYGTPGGNETPGGFGTSAGFETPGGCGTPVGYGIAQPSWQPEDWRLVLTPGAKQLLGWFIGLGAVLYAGYLVLIAILVSSASSTNNAIGTVSNAHDTLVNQLNGWESAQQACNDLTCAESGDTKAAGYFSSFASTLQATPMPSGDSASAASNLYNDATKAAQELTQLSHATSVAKYQSTLTSSGFQQTLDQFDQDYNALGTALGAT